jgi:hypothetical protein
MSRLGPQAALGLLLALACGLPAAAQDRAADPTLQEARRAQLERLRAELTAQIHLQANDLVDELVFSWLSSPPFATPTPVVLADVIAPLSYGSGLLALLENHLAQVLLKNPGTNVQLAHCPPCTALVVHSDATGTVIGRGVDQPGALAKLRGASGAGHALFLDFEAEGSALVLRARVTKLEDALPIVYARTLSTRTQSAALLRSPGRLVSAEEARDEYLAILEQRGPFTIPVRLALTVFAPSNDGNLEIPLPIPWLHIGVEYAISSARAWTGSLTLGGTYIPTVQAGAIVQARAARLLTGSEVSLTHPNVYGFVGVGLAVLQGNTASLLNTTPTGDLGPIASYLSLQTGLEVRVSRRIGATFYVESIPTLWAHDFVGNYLANGPFGFIQLNSIGAEATFAF